MPAFILSRLLQAIPVLFVVGFIAYAMFSFVGDPVKAMLGIEATDAQRIELQHNLGLDQPFLVQYAEFMWRAAHGDFGVSYRLARPVAVFFRLETPVSFDAADGMPVDLVFGLLSPDQAGAAHLHALAAISRLMRDDRMHQALSEAPGAEALYGLLCNVIDRDAA